MSEKKSVKVVMKNDCSDCSDFRVIEQTFKNGTVHLRKECKKCNKFLGYMPHPLDVKTTKIWFGKHRGKLVRECPRDYLEWLTQQDWVKQNLRDLCKKITAVNF